MCWSVLKRIIYEHLQKSLFSILSFFSGILENRQVCGGRIQSLQSWCYYVGWSLCLSLSLTCFIITGTLGVKWVIFLLVLYSVAAWILLGHNICFPNIWKLGFKFVTLQVRQNKDSSLGLFCVLFSCLLWLCTASSNGKSSWSRTQICIWFRFNIWLTFPGS